MMFNHLIHFTNYDHLFSYQTSEEYRKSVVGFKRKIRPFRTRLVTLNCILSHRDRGRSSRERGLQASPRPFLGLFLGLFFF